MLTGKSNYARRESADKKELSDRWERTGGTNFKRGRGAWVKDIGFLSSVSPPSRLKALLRSYDYEEADEVQFPRISEDSHHLGPQHCWPWNCLFY